jgi:hypothetical protein
MKTGAAIKMKNAATHRVCFAASFDWAIATIVAVKTPKANKCRKRRSRIRQTFGANATIAVKRKIHTTKHLRTS